MYEQGCELIGRPEKVSIGDQLETTFKVKWRPFGYQLEDNWRPIIKLSIVSSSIGSNNFGLRKMAPQSRNAKYAIMSTLIFKCHFQAFRVFF